MNLGFLTEKGIAILGRRISNMSDWIAQIGSNGYFFLNIFEPLHFLGPLVCCHRKL